MNYVGCVIILRKQLGFAGASLLELTCFDQHGSFILLLLHIMLCLIQHYIDSISGFFGADLWRQSRWCFPLPPLIICLQWSWCFSNGFLDEIFSEFCFWGIPLIYGYWPWMVYLVYPSGRLAILWFNRFRPKTGWGQQFMYIVVILEYDYDLIYLHW